MTHLRQPHQKSAPIFCIIWDIMDFFPLEGGSFYSFCGIDKNEFSPTPRHPLTTYSNDKYLISHIPLASYMIHTQQHQISHLFNPYRFLFFSSLLCYDRKNGNLVCLCLSLFIFFPCLERVTAVKEEDSARACLAVRKAVSVIYRGMMILY